MPWKEWNDKPLPSILKLESLKGMSLEMETKINTRKKNVESSQFVALEWFEFIQARKPEPSQSNEFWGDLRISWFVALNKKPPSPSHWPHHLPSLLPPSWVQFLSLSAYATTDQLQRQQVKAWLLEHKTRWWQRQWTWRQQNKVGS